MPFTNAYRDYIAAATIGESVTAFNNASAHIGVGSGSTAYSASQTDLVGPSKSWKAMDAGYPSRAANVLTFRSTFGQADANHAWSEWGIRNGASSGVLLNRAVASNGTKASNETKVFTCTITIGV